ncbi:glutamine-hydrolyzing carbamoyl-phosphate synthase small subunit [Candidatus Karelsulcia muelleri]|uniref:glutamine-hydrolyzing carbamoyl-phosphate synthase small subunit n=1 Tax=Candidatus Karelsulcia muelleri TaxID=336810 RepID=UPI0021694927|nr:glutamine-hydrolyzing carbamoyl-phosphate synthase small subunit [Candidatus Karelsulcia muelleri]
MINKNAKFILEDGSLYEAYSFGYEKSSAGEIVFNTSMTGYNESLTDPSYKGQILVYTYPLIGNYGIPKIISEKKNIKKFFESNNIHVSGLITSYYLDSAFHWNMYKKLSYFLKINNTVGIYGIDTRSLTKKLRDKGTMLGKIIISDNVKFYNPDNYNLVDKVSIKKKTIYGDGKQKILLIDCGVKNNIIRCFLERDCTVIRVPWNYNNLINEEYDGLFISNGPGNPKGYKTTINNISKAFICNKPIFGICLGNQLLGLAAGFYTHKLKYGHRSNNQPVILSGTNRCFITSQNHGYVIDSNKIPNGWKIFFKNLNDNTCEGLINYEKNFISVQFHPEASSGPTDSQFLFDVFLNFIKTNNN